MRQEHGRLIRETSERLRSLAAVLDIKGVQVAEMTGGAVTAPRWSEYLRGKRLVTVDAAMALRRVFGVTLDYLYAGDMAGLPHYLALKLQQDPQGEIDFDRDGNFIARH